MLWCLVLFCPTLCGPMDWSLPDSSVHEIFQGRMLEWVAISYSRGSSRPKDRTHISESPALAGGFFTTVLPGKAKLFGYRRCLCLHLEKNYTPIEKYEHSSCLLFLPAVGMVSLFNFSCLRRVRVSCFNYFNLHFYDE